MHDLDPPPASFYAQRVAKARWNRVRETGNGVQALTVRIPVPAASAALAGGGTVKASHEGGVTVFRIDLDVADTLIVRQLVTRR